MIPITRKELYLNKIVGNDDYSVPEKPISEEEFFFAEILGEAVQAPEPLTRYQMYLAKIAGRNIEIPYPEVRLEYFLARAAGMEIEAPTPITREEMFWADYALIVEKELSGIPPLTFNAVAGTLKNYRIYGNTVNGENVGDLITEGEHAGEYSVPVTVEGKNLFSSRIEQGSFDGITGVPNNSSTRVRSHEDDYIFLTPGVYKISAMGVEHLVVYAYDLPDVNAFNYNLSSTNWVPLPSTITINTSAYYKFAFCKTNNPIITPSDVSNIMLNTGSTALPYEPYHAPVTTPIYLPEPIKMIGDEAEYIDYAEQKQHRARKNLFDVSTITPDCYVDNEGRIIGNDGIDTSAFIKVSPNTNYTYKGVVIYNTNTIRIAYYDQFKNFISRHFIIGNAADGETVTTPSNCEYVKLSYDKVIINLMLNSGSTALPYEPYIENTDLDVTLPALPTVTGTNVLSVGTEVQPSNVYIKYEGAR